MTSTQPDISPREFRSALIDHGFAYLGRGVDKYVDITAHRPGRYLEAVKNARGQILRRETLAALLAVWRHPSMPGLRRPHGRNGASDCCSAAGQENLTDRAPRRFSGAGEGKW